MKIFLLHGENELKAYERLQKFIETAKSRSWEVVYVDETALSLREVFISKSLLSGESFFILRDISKLSKRETDWLKKVSDRLDGNLIIYYKGIAPVTFIKSLPETIKIEEFKLPKLLFEFLESVRPKNQKRAIELFHRVTETEPAEMVFSLLSRQLRDIYWVKAEEGSLPYPSWRVGKLKTQAINYSTNQLIKLIGNLAEIDIEAKTSNAEIIPSLDLLIATKLE